MYSTMCKSINGHLVFTSRFLGDPFTPILAAIIVRTGRMPVNTLSKYLLNIKKYIRLIYMRQNEVRPTEDRDKNS